MAWGLENHLAIGDNFTTLSLFKLWQNKENNNQWSYQLIWRTHGSLVSIGFSLHQVTGLSPRYEQLLKQHSGREGLKGKPADPQRLTSEDVLKVRNSQMYIPGGELKCTWLKDVGHNTGAILNKNNWLISLVRYKPKVKKGTGGYYSTKHLWLLIQGINEANYTEFYKIECLLDESQPTRMGGTLGTALIVERPCAPYDIYACGDNYEARSWPCTKGQIDELRAQVAKDTQEGVSYLLSGRDLGFFSNEKAAYSCVSWCEKQLRGIGIDPLDKRPYSNNICAIPDHYFPKAVNEGDEPNTKGCQTM